MTLYGEQEGDEIDKELADKNQELWNAWVTQALPVEKLNELFAIPTGQSGPQPLDASLSESIQKMFSQQWQLRNPDIEVPDTPLPESTVDFSETHFSSPLSAEGMAFSWVKFDGARFEKITSLRFAQFVRSANFNRASFFSPCGFDTCDFCYGAFFVEARFEALADFSSARFRDYTTFRKVTFQSSCSFDDVIFDETVSFMRSSFLGNVDFFNCKFEDAANFMKGHFQGGASFQNASFQEVSNFKGVRLSGGVDFHGTYFGRATVFTGAVFETHGSFPSIDFTSAVFAGSTSFEGAIFERTFPKLTGVSFNETTTVTVRNDNWPSASEALAQHGTESVAELREAASKLRHVMSRQMLPEEEHFFFRYEMLAASREESFFRALPIRLYGFLSEYGYSIGRPVILLTALWVVGWYFYAQNTAMGLGKSAAYSFSAMFKFFGLQGTYLETETENLSEAMQVAAGTQTVLAFIPLFFLGLGLRTRFRLR